MKTPDYILIEEFVYSVMMGQEITLPVGAFVKPIEPCYLPTHILKSDNNRWVDLKTHSFCYTRIGIIPIPNKLIRRTNA